MTTIPMTHEEEIRFHALRLAVKYCMEINSAKSVEEKAKDFYNFIKGT